MSVLTGRSVCKCTILYCVSIGCYASYSGRPHTMLLHCTGGLCQSTPVDTEDSDEFEWCGGFYSWGDLRQALSVLCTPHHHPSQHQGQDHTDSSLDQPLSQGQTGGSPDQPSGQHQAVLPGPDLRSGLTSIQGSTAAQPPDLGQIEDEAADCQPESGMSLADQYADPWLPGAWNILGRPAELLLAGLAQAEMIPWVCAAVLCCAMLCSALSCCPGLQTAMLHCAPLRCCSLQHGL